MWRHATLVERVADDGGELGIEDLARGDVDRGGRARCDYAVVDPALELAQRLTQRPRADLADDAGLLGDRDEVQRGHDRTLALPADQCLEAAEVPGLEIDD